ncbi:TRAP transporter large permease [Alkalihalobacillus oceani]|uniref:TRAP transporter large permease n=1 Tax=Halalkalibacter oceani TaxID=1653776 RepID=A0A9X2DPV8_9BACI|nr:TRAP transporter large permease [Halalkalibacter oceani]MCM3713955.1 TRAP transporter large permease [Halalkalibacter oceani]
MSAGTIGILLLGIFFLLMILRIPIAISLSLASIITLLATGMAPAMFADIMEASVSSTALLAIPFFIIAGNIINHSGISQRIVRFVELLIGPIPGGLAIVSVIVVTFWGAISGSGPATVVALGPVLIPLMVNAGYNKAFAASIIAAAGGIAVVIPPSITFIVYGVVAEGASVGKLFAAGILPGILMGLAFCVYVFLYSVRHGYKGQVRGSRKEIFRAFWASFLGLLSPVIILGGIYGGIFTPTEAAAVAAFYSLFIGVVAYRQIKRENFMPVMVDSAVDSAMILLITAGAGVMAWLVTTTGIASAVTTLLMGISTNQYIIITVIFFILVMAGFFLDGISITYLFVPLLLPAVMQMGYDITWFGVILVVAVSIGMITPPVAANIYPAAQIAGVSLHAISKQIIGFLITGIIVGLLLLYIPQISLLIPNLLGL